VMWYDGNNPLNTTGSGTVGNMDHSEFKTIDNPILRNDAMKKSAFVWIKSNPAEFVKLSLKKLFRFWSFIPNASEYKGWLYSLIAIASFVPLVFGSLLFVFQLNRSLFLKLIPIFILFIYLTLIHSVTIGSIRYRFPLEGFMIIFSAYSLLSLFSRKQVDNY